jgi:hypothetical protein
MFTFVLLATTPVVLLLSAFVVTFVVEPPGSEALSELRLEYYEKFSARFDLEIERAKPEGPYVN